MRGIFNMILYKKMDHTN